MDVAAVLLNYGTAEATLDAWRRLRDAVPHVLVVDNGSPDGDRLREAFSEGEATRRDGEEHVDLDGDRLVLLPENVGYAGGNNRGIEIAVEAWEPANVLVCNPDAVVPGSTVEAMVDAVPEHGAGVVTAGPRPDPLSLRERARRAFLWPGDRRWIEDDVLQLGIAPGWAMLLSRDTVDALGDRWGGVFDERLFIYQDEIALGWRLDELGIGAVYLVDEDVRHEGGESVDATGAPIREYYSTRNLHLIARQRPLPRRLLAHGFHSLRALAEMVLHALRGDGARLRAVAAGLRDGWAGRTGRWPGH